MRSKHPLGYGLARERGSESTVSNCEKCLQIREEKEGAVAKPEKIKKCGFNFDALF